MQRKILRLLLAVGLGFLCLPAISCTNANNVNGTRNDGTTARSRRNAARALKRGVPEAMRPEPTAGLQVAQEDRRAAVRRWLDENLEVIAAQRRQDVPDARPLSLLELRQTLNAMLEGPAADTLVQNMLLAISENRNPRVSVANPINGFNDLVEQAAQHRQKPALYRLISNACVWARANKVEFVTTALAYSLIYFMHTPEIFQKCLKIMPIVGCISLVLHGLPILSNRFRRS
jgi:hypothetical protein